MITIDCPRCGGKGEIPAFRGILGGVCFACKGSGKKVCKTAPKPKLRWPISAIRKETGELIGPIFCVCDVKNAEKAKEKAIKQLRGGNGYIPESVVVHEPEPANQPI